MSNTAKALSRGAVRTVTVVLVVVLIGFVGGLLTTSMFRESGSSVAVPATTAVPRGTQQPPAKAGPGERTTSPVAVAVLAALVGVIGLALGRRSAPVASDSAAGSTAVALGAIAGPPRAGSSAAPSVADIEHLAVACLHLSDSVSSSALRSDIDVALRAAGYDLLVPTGQPFDPALHDAVERRPTTDARDHNVVAATYRAGCRGRGHLLRSPEVAVFRFEGGR